MTYGESADLFQRTFGPGQGRYRGNMSYVGGSTFKIGGLKLTNNSEAEFDALVTFEKDRTTIVNLKTNRTLEILFNLGGVNGLARL